MTTCGFGDRSVIVVAVVCVILIGALGYYFNSRIVNLERSIVKQNHVLTEFITNVRGNAILSSGGEPLPKPSHESPRPCPPLEKIGVSDSEDSSTDDSTCCYETNVEEDTMLKTLSIGTSGMMDMNDFGVVILQMGHQQTTSRPDIVELYDEVKEPAVIKLGDLENVEQLDKLSANSIASSTHGDNESTTAGTSIDFKKMKLTQLKDIASSKGIDVKGKKKNELVETLNKQ